MSMILYVSASFVLCFILTRSPLAPGVPTAPGSPFCPRTPGGPRAPGAPTSTESADAPYSTQTKKKKYKCL